PDVVPGHPAVLGPPDAADVIDSPFTVRGDARVEHQLRHEDGPDRYKGHVVVHVRDLDLSADLYCVLSRIVWSLETCELGPLLFPSGPEYEPVDSVVGRE